MPGSEVRWVPEVLLGGVHGEKPYLQFVGADDVGDDEVIGAVIAVVGGVPGHRVGLFKDDFVGVEQAGHLGSGIFAAFGGAGDKGAVGDIVGHGDGDAAEGLDAFSDLIDEFELGFKVFIKEQMQRVEGGAGDLPVMFFIQVAEGEGVGEELIEVIDADVASFLIQGNRQSAVETKGLGFLAE